MASDNPLILTLRLDDSSFRFFNELRQEHFPSERNYLDAHLTLFHQLPGAEAESITQELTRISEQYTPIKMAVREVRLLGKGVGYRLESRLLQQLHRQLQKQWQAWLTPQDQSKLWPHVTVQNKVSPNEARGLYIKLANDFEPFEATGTGLQLWEYLGGPWELQQDFGFRKSP